MVQTAGRSGQIHARRIQLKQASTRFSLARATAVSALVTLNWLEAVPTALRSRASIESSWRSGDFATRVDPYVENAEGVGPHRAESEGPQKLSLPDLPDGR